ncbi:unnamed protein product [Prorocentrum cordatum]|uniref:Uncharacterized protein n=1 Tax=Prorocentrum cordatum TaxID=2364126 RepID=A0ABN9T9B5_9DINO|nr:unnamed protein product [Polarella glacialis]
MRRISYTTYPQDFYESQRWVPHKLERHRKAQYEFWQQCQATISNIPRRSALVWCLSAISVAPSPPNAGFAGSRRHPCRTSQNGSKFFAVIQKQGLAALSAFGKASRFNSTSARTDGKSWSILDYTCVRFHGGHGHRGRSLRDLPVSLGGFRDHMPVDAQIYAGLRCKFRRPEADIKWGRDLVVQDSKELHRASREDGEHLVPRRVFRLRDAVDLHLRGRRLRGQRPQVCGPGKDNHDASACFDALEGAAADAAVEIYTAKPTERGAPAFPVETLKAIAQKQMCQRMLAEAVAGSWLHKSLRRLKVAKLAKRAVRAHRRQQKAELVDQAARADQRHDTWKNYAIIRRLAPKPTAPSMTAHNPETGMVCFDHDGGTWLHVSRPCAPSSRLRISS